MNGQQRSLRNTGLLFRMGIIASLILAGCNYPNQPAATDMATATNPPAPTAVTPSPTRLPSATPAPSSTPTLSPTPAASSTPEATATQSTEQVGVVLLFDKQIGAIFKKGNKFIYQPNPELPTPEVQNQVILQVMDPLKVWSFELENTSSPFYRFTRDQRPGWEGFGTLVAYDGGYEMTLSFTAHNTQSGEKIKNRIEVAITGAMAVTVTPEAEGPPQ